MTPDQERVLRELTECTDGRASKEALRLCVKLGLGDWTILQLELEERGLIVQDKRAPGVVVLTATGLVRLFEQKMRAAA